MWSLNGHIFLFYFLFFNCFSHHLMGTLVLGHNFRNMDLIFISLSSLRSAEVRPFSRQNSLSWMPPLFFHPFFSFFQKFKNKQVITVTRLHCDLVVTCRKGPNAPRFYLLVSISSFFPPYTQQSFPNTSCMQNRVFIILFFISCYLST